MSTKVVVTGASGRVGRAVLAELAGAGDYEVWAVDRTLSGPGERRPLPAGRPRRRRIGVRRPGRGRRRDPPGRLPQHGPPPGRAGLHQQHRGDGARRGRLRRRWGSSGSSTPRRSPPTAWRSRPARGGCRPSPGRVARPRPGRLLRPVQVGRRGDLHPGGAGARAARGLPAHRPRGRARTSTPSGAGRGASGTPPPGCGPTSTRVTWPRPRAWRSSTWTTWAPATTPSTSAPADAHSEAPAVEVIPRFVPALAPLAAGLSGTTPAYGIEKARRLLGYAPRYSWRTELGRSRRGGLRSGPRAPGSGSACPACGPPR